MSDARVSPGPLGVLVLHAPHRTGLTLALAASLLMGLNAAPPAALAETAPVVDVAATPSPEPTVAPSAVPDVELAVIETPSPTPEPAVSPALEPPALEPASPTPEPTVAPNPVPTAQAITDLLIETTTTLAVVPNPGPVFALITLTATVSPVPSAGHVEWTIDGSAAGSTDVAASGTAAITRSWPDPGLHTALATFVEGTAFAGSASLTVDFEVVQVAHAVSATPNRPLVTEGGHTTIHVTVAGAADGRIDLRDGDIVVTSCPVDAAGRCDIVTPAIYSETTFTVDYVAAGASSVSGSTAVTIGVRYQDASFYLAASPSTVASGEGLVRFVATTDQYDATGTVRFVDHLDGVTTVLGASDVTQDDTGDSAFAILSARLTGVGTHTVTAEYSGDDYYAPGENTASIEIEVTPDTGVAATGVGVQYSTFYPFKDGYRDTVAIRGQLLEQGSVAIRVYSPTGRVVRSFTVSSRTGAYSIAWNGRNAAGTLQAAAKYKVVQTLRDALGHTRAVTSYTTLSKKRLYWHTATITKYGDSVFAYNSSDWGWVRGSSRYAHGADIYGNLYDEWAWVGYSFTLKSAVKYGTLTFAVLGRTWPGRGAPYLSFWNYAHDEEDGVRWISGAYGWHSDSVSSTGRMTSTHRVHAYVTVLGENQGWYDIAKVRLTYRYATLG